MIKRFTLFLAAVAIGVTPASGTEGINEEDMANLEEEIEQLSSFTYQPDGKRDPFQPPASWLERNAVTEEEVAVVPELGRPKRQKEFLEAFHLDSLNLVAILFKVGARNPAAMVQDPEGRGHVVRPGNYIGVNSGRISRITDGAVEIIEPLRNPVGKNTTRTITLRLSDRNKENASTGIK